MAASETHRPGNNQIIQMQPTRLQTKNRRRMREFASQARMIEYLLTQGKLAAIQTNNFTLLSKLFS